MNITIQPTAALILSIVSEEQIFNMYGLTPREGLILNPFRVDRKPTCSFYRTQSNSLRFIDYSGWCNWNCWGLVMYLHNCTYPQSIDIVYKDVLSNKSTLVDIKPIEKETKIFESRIREFRKEDLDFWNKSGITKSTLEKYETYGCEWLRINGEVVYLDNKYNPGYVYDFHQGEMKTYFPKGSPKFLGNSNKLQGYNQLPEEGNVLVIQKSMKDTMLMDELDIPSVAPSAESSHIDESYIVELKSRFKTVYSWYDNDMAGITGSSRLKDKYDIEPLMFSTDEPKDCTDYTTIYGKEKLINHKLIKKLHNEL